MQAKAHRGRHTNETMGFTTRRAMGEGRGEGKLGFCGVRSKVSVTVNTAASRGSGISSIVFEVRAHGQEVGILQEFS